MLQTSLLIHIYDHFKILILLMISFTEFYHVFYRLHIVDEFNRDVYDYIIASDETVLETVGTLRILKMQKTLNLVNIT